MSEADDVQAAVNQILDENKHVEEATPFKFDIKIKKEATEAAVQNRCIDDYKRVLEYFHFNFYPVHVMPPFNNGQPRVEGEYRCGYLKAAFTPTQILAHFVSPEDFHNWASEQVKLKQMKERGFLR